MQDNGLPLSITRLPLEPVAVEAPPVHVNTSWPADVVVGVQALVGIRVQNCSALAQELGIAVSDSAGFVFAGDRTSSVTVLPHSALEVRHTFIAHCAGWQPLPEVAITAKRYSARLSASPVFRLVCVRPAGTALCAGLQ